MNAMHQTDIDFRAELARVIALASPDVAPAAPDDDGCLFPPDWQPGGPQSNGRQAVLRAHLESLPDLMVFGVYALACMPKGYGRNKLHPKTLGNNVVAYRKHRQRDDVITTLSAPAFRLGPLLDRAIAYAERSGVDLDECYLELLWDDQTLG